MCVRRYRSVIDVKVDTQGCDFDEDVVSHRFEGGVESNLENSVTETKVVWVCQGCVVYDHMINSRSFKKSVVSR